MNGQRALVRKRITWICRAGYVSRGSLWISLWQLTVVMASVIGSSRCEAQIAEEPYIVTEGPRDVWPWHKDMTAEQWQARERMSSAEREAFDKPRRDAHYKRVWDNLPPQRRNELLEVELQSQLKNIEHNKSRGRTSGPDFERQQDKLQQIRDDISRTQREIRGTAPSDKRPTRNQINPTGNNAGGQNRPTTTADTPDGAPRLNETQPFQQDAIPDGNNAGTNTDADGPGSTGDADGTRTTGDADGPDARPTGDVDGPSGTGKGAGVGSRVLKGVGTAGGVIGIANAGQLGVDYVEGRITGEELGEGVADGATLGLLGKGTDRAEAQGVLEKAQDDAEFVRRNKAERALTGAGVSPEEVSSIRDAMLQGDDAPLNNKLTELNQGRAAGEQIFVSERTELGGVEADEAYGAPLTRVPGELVDATVRAGEFVVGTADRLDNIQSDARESVGTQNQANQIDEALKDQDPALRASVMSAIERDRSQFPASWTDEEILNWVIANRDRGNPEQLPVTAENTTKPPEATGPLDGGGGGNEGTEKDETATEVATTKPEPAMTPEQLAEMERIQPREGFEGGSLADFMDQLERIPAVGNPPQDEHSGEKAPRGPSGTTEQLILDELHRLGVPGGNLQGIYSDGSERPTVNNDSGDFADQTIGSDLTAGPPPGTSPVYIRPNLTTTVNEDAFNSGVTAIEQAMNARYSADYPQAARLKRALDDYKRAKAEYRRMQAEHRRAQEIAEYQRQLKEYYRQVAWQEQQYNNWLKQQHAAQQQQQYQPVGGHSSGH